MIKEKLAKHLPKKMHVVWQAMMMVWFEEYGLKSNVLESVPTSKFLVPRVTKLGDDLKEAVYSNDILCLYGKTGVGKTSLVYKVIEDLDKSKYQPVLVDLRDIKDLDEFATHITTNAFSSISNIFSGFLKKTWTNRVKTSFGKNKKKRLVLFVDEAQIVRDPRIPEAIGSLRDAGSPVILLSIEPVDKNPEYVDSIRTGRTGEPLLFEEFSYEELKEILRERIEAGGGKDIDPFSEEALRIVVSKRGGLPRAVLNALEDLAKFNIKIGGSKEEITGEVAKQFFNRERTGERRNKTVASEPIQIEENDVKFDDLRQVYNELSSSQKKIIDALASRDSTIQELETRTGIGYGTIGKEMSRLSLALDKEVMKNKGIGEPVVDKFPGRPVIYSLSKKWKLWMVKE